MEKKNEDIIDGIICILAMFLIVWILTILDGKIHKNEEKDLHRHFLDEGHLRPGDG